MDCPARGVFKNTLPIHLWTALLQSIAVAISAMLNPWGVDQSTQGRILHRGSGPGRQ